MASSKPKHVVMFS